MSSFEMNKMNHFPALTAPFPQIRLSNLLIPEEVALTHPVKLLLAKGIGRSNTTFLPNLPNQEPRNLPD